MTDHIVDANKLVRAEFEAWAHKSPANLAKDAAGGYQSATVAFAWRAVQAATQRQQERIAELQAQVKALRRDNDRLTEKAETHAAINRACDELPEGYDLHIELEKNAGTVRLYLDGDDTSIDDFGSDLTFVETINAAIDAAIAAGKGEG